MSVIAPSKVDQLVLLVVIVLLTFVLARSWRRDAPSGRPSLGLDRLVEEVRADLERMDRVRIAENREALFVVETFDLELNFVVREGTTSDASGHFEVVTVGGKSEYSSERVQKIQLHLKAQPDRHGRVPATPQ